MLKDYNKTMLTRKFLHLTLLSFFVFFSLSACKNQDPTTDEPLSIKEQIKLKAYKKLEPVITALSWSDLMPEGFTATSQPFLFSLGDEAPTAAPEEVPVVEELNGKEIRIPGYIVPLAGHEEVITEFLLVPYFGACIHVPPPPANQIVHVKPKYPLLVNESYDLVFVLGKLEAQISTNQYAHVSYLIEDALLIPYSEEEAKSSNSIGRDQPLT